MISLVRGRPRLGKTECYQTNCPTCERAELETVESLPKAGKGKVEILGFSLFARPRSVGSTPIFRLNQATIRNCDRRRPTLLGALRDLNSATVFGDAGFVGVTRLRPVIEPSSDSLHPSRFRM